MIARYLLLDAQRDSLLEVSMNDAFATPTNLPEEGHNVAASPGIEAPGTLGRYLLGAKHAEGGLGEVFRAIDTELNRDVALKRIKALNPDADRCRRFLVEGEVTGRLEHPGVVPVYGLGHDAAGRPFYVMRFVRGETLQEAIQRFHAADRPGRDPGERSKALRELLGQFVATCNTMAYAHSRGILHRDLKPSNIMLGPYGETLVVDWGLAKPFTRSEEARSVGEETLAVGADDSQQTQQGQAVGTPQYMSPEQAAGRWTPWARPATSTVSAPRSTICWRARCRSTAATSATCWTRSNAVPFRRRISARLKCRWRWRRSVSRPWHWRRKTATRRPWTWPRR